jgi:hypothetical protein
MLKDFIDKRKVKGSKIICYGIKVNEDDKLRARGLFMDDAKDTFKFVGHICDSMNNAIEYLTKEGKTVKTIAIEMEE